MSWAGVLPDFPWDLLAPHGTRAARAPGRAGRPVRRHAGRPDPGGGPGRAGRGLGRARLPAYGRHAGAARGGGRLAAPGARRHRARRRGRCCPRSAPRSWSRCCRCCCGSARATGSCCPRWRTRRTRWGCGWSGPSRSRADSTVAAGPGPVRLVWLNSPANPSGRVLPADAPAQGRRLGPGARRRRGQRRVLPRLRLGGRAGLGAAPGGDRRRPHRRAGRALAVQAVQPGRLPGRVRGRRPGAGRRPAGDAQARRADRAGAGAGGRHRRVRGRHARGRAARAVRGPPSAAAPGAGEGRLHRRALRGRALPLGDPRAGRLGRGRGAGRSSGSWSRRAPSTARPASGTCGSRSPRPTNGSRRPRSGWPADRMRRGAAAGGQRPGRHEEPVLVHAPQPHVLDRPVRALQHEALGDLGR